MYSVAFFVVYLFGFFLKLYPAVYFVGYILSLYYLLCLFIETNVKTVLVPVIRLLLRLNGGYFMFHYYKFENVYMHVLHTIAWIHFSLWSTSTTHVSSKYLNLFFKLVLIHFI